MPNPVRSKQISLILICTAILVAAYSARPASRTIPLSEPDVILTGVEAYIYGYPLVTMEMTRRVMTNAVAPEGTHGPMGQFVSLREYPTAAFHEVTTPNADTLYSAAWLDLSREPYVFNIPDAHGRYYLMPMMDAWTNVFEDPGTRTTGTKAQKYAITGPGWHGTIPAGVTEYKSPTNLVWILGRTYCNGTPEDYKAVHEFQDQLSLVPLSSYGKPYTPPSGHVDPNVEMRTAVRDQVNALGALAYFKLLAELMKNNPPAAADAPILARISRIGIVPGQEFDVTQLGSTTAAAFQNVPLLAQKEMMGSLPSGGTSVNGWHIVLKTGVYGTDYLTRAMEFCSESMGLESQLIYSPA